MHPPHAHKSLSHLPVLSHTFESQLDLKITYVYIYIYVCVRARVFFFFLHVFMYVCIKKAGETIEGVVSLVTGKDITCRSVKMKLECKAVAHWHDYRSDDEGNQKRQDFHGHRNYLESKMTVFGNFYATSCLDSAGANAEWDPSDGTGDMPIYLQPEDNLEDMTLAVRVMDYDWGKKDDLIGEVLVKANDLLANPGVPKSFNLVKKGEVTLSATLKTHSSGKQIYALVAHKATGLKSADMFGKNDVYVQCYKVPSDTNPSKKLPEFEKSVVLPAGTYAYPFSFKIPVGNMPSSFECGMEDYSYVRWSLYSNIDISWKLDPSSRRYITVMSADAPPKNLFSPAIRAASEPVTIYGCDCCCGCCRCCEKGSAQFNAAVDKQCAAPGDVIRVSCEAINNTSEMEANLTVTLVMNVTLHAGTGQSTRGFKSWTLYSEPLAPGAKVSWSSADPKVLTIPGRRDVCFSFFFLFIFLYSIIFSLSLYIILCCPCQRGVFFLSCAWV
jgi:hypothetical protein